MHVDDLTPFEARLVRQARSGEPVDCMVLPPDGATDAGSREVRGAVLSALIAGDVPEWRLHPRAGLHLRGATVTGPVDLDLARCTPAPLRFESCRFYDGMSLAGAHVGSVEFVKCFVDELYADELQSDAALHMYDSTIGHLSLTDANVRGVVSLARTHVTREDVAIAADRLTCGGLVLR